MGIVVGIHIEVSENDVVGVLAENNLVASQARKYRLLRFLLKKYKAPDIP